MKAEIFWGWGLTLETEHKRTILYEVGDKLHSEGFSLETPI